MIFVALGPGDDVRQLIAPFVRATNPTYRGLIVKPPLGYNANGMTAMGAAQVNIGQWFATTPVMVIKDFQPRFSHAVIGNGSPLYCVAQMTFESYRMLSADEVLNFFRIGGSSPYSSASGSYPSPTPSTTPNTANDPNLNAVSISYTSDLDI